MRDVFTFMTQNKLFQPRLWPKTVIFAFKVLTVVFTLIIIHESLIPAGPKTHIVHFDKIMHFLAYGVLAGAMRLGWPHIYGGVIILAFGLLGVGLEVAQATLALGRSGSIYDAIANIAGTVMALLILYPFRK